MNVGASAIRQSDPLARASMRNHDIDVVVMAADPVIRAGVSVMLREVPVVRKVTSCQDPDEAMRAMSASRVDVLMLPSSKAEPGLERMANLVTSAGIKTLVLVEDADIDDIARSMSLSPDGMVLRAGCNSDVLTHTLARLVDGEMPIPAPVARKLLTQVGVPRDAPQGKPAHSPLTGREQQALELLAQGCSNKQIARRLGISEHGAKRYVSNVLAKLNCRNRTSAVAWALKSGLIGGPVDS